VVVVDISVNGGWHYGLYAGHANSYCGKSPAVRTCRSDGSSLSKIASSVLIYFDYKRNNMSTDREKGRCRVSGQKKTMLFISHCYILTLVVISTGFTFIIYYILTVASSRTRTSGFHCTGVFRTVRGDFAILILIVASA
jgi:hypothetical protein